MSGITLSSKCPMRNPQHPLNTPLLYNPVWHTSNKDMYVKISGYFHWGHTFITFCRKVMQTLSSLNIDWGIIFNHPHPLNHKVSFGWNLASSIKHEYIELKACFNHTFQFYQVLIDKGNTILTLILLKQDQRSTAPTRYQLFSFSHQVSASDFQSVIIICSVSDFNLCLIKLSQLGSSGNNFGPFGTVWESLGTIWVSHVTIWE